IASRTFLARLLKLEMSFAILTASTCNSFRTDGKALAYLSIFSIVFTPPGVFDLLNDSSIENIKDSWYFLTAHLSAVIKWQRISRVRWIATQASYQQCVPIRLTQTPTRASVDPHGGHGHPPARRSGFSSVAP